MFVLFMRFYSLDQNFERASKNRMSSIRLLRVPVEYIY